MAQYRQPGVDRLGVHHHPYANGSSEHVSIGIRAHSSKPLRLRRSSKSRRISVGVVSLVLCFALILSVFAFDYFTREPKEIRRHNVEEDDVKDDSDFLANVSRTERSKVLKFGLGSVAHGRDSRYWDTDDRRRDEDYNEDLLEHGRPYAKEGLISDDHVPLNMKNSDGKLSSNDSHRNLDHKGVGLYNEAGRDELKMYEAAYEASLKNVGHAGKKIGGENLLSTNASVDGQHEAVDVDEYDDGIDLHDAHLEEDENIHDNDVDLNSVEAHNEKSSGTRDWEAVEEVENVSIHSTESSLYSSYSTTNSGGVTDVVNHSKGKFSSEMHSDPKRKLKRRKYAGCEIKFINSTAQLVEPLETRKFAQFFLQYKEVEEKPEELDKWEPRFAGHQTLQEREESFLARDHEINCGFVRGPEGFQGTGFDLAEDDARYTSTCHIAVVSCIFGNSDRLRTPTGKKVTRMSKKNVCFVMFMDETTLKTISLEGQVRDGTGFIGLWKIIVVKNLPYTDMRRVGKIPKLLSHRLFPSARYSIWLDSKLRLQLDPYFILDHFLWRKGYEYAISNHYDRHCIWEEVAQNKKLNKYNHTVIDQQFAFYRADGLKRFNASDPNKLLPSNVPEGSLIIRAHTPMSNLFSCLWFNEVERFTPRDQLSFAYTYQKLRRMNPAKPFHLNMFKDCERRAIAKLYHHRSEEKKVVPLQAQE